jgi:hypothetical protein
MAASAVAGSSWCWGVCALVLVVVVVVAAVAMLVMVVFAVQRRWQCW